MSATSFSPTHDELRLITAAAHELKTPLTIIAQLAAALEDPAMQLSAAQRQYYLERIRLSAQRTLRLVQGLSTSYRLGEPGQLTFGLQLEPVNIAHICQEVAAEMAPFAKAQRQVIVPQFRVRSPIVIADRRLLHNAFFNLVDNAIRHNPAETEVRINAQRRGTMVRVSVCDDGPGIGRNELTTLRQRLGTQVQPILSRSSNSGLGLYIVGQLVAAMGGTLGLGRSQRGATFYVDLLHSQQLSLL